MPHLFLLRLRLILSDHEMGNEIDDRIESRSVEIALQMGNEIDRVVVTGGMRSIESRSVEFALQTGNGK